MNRIQPTDFLEFRYPSALEASPDERTLSFLVKQANDSGYDSDLYTVDITCGTLRRQTQLKDVSWYGWLTDGRILLASAAGQAIAAKKETGEDWTSYYTLDIASGEITAAFDIPLAVTKLRELAPGRFVLTARVDANEPEPATLDDAGRAAVIQARKDRADYDVLNEVPFYANGEAGFRSGIRNRLYLFDAETCQLTPLSERYEDVTLFQIAADKALYVSRTYQDILPATAAVKEHNFVSATTSTLVAPDALRVSAAWYVGDEVWFAATDGVPYGPAQHKHIYRVIADSYRAFMTIDITLGNAVGSDSRMGGFTAARARDGQLHHISTVGYDSHLLTIAADGGVTTVVGLPGSVDDFAFAGGKTYLIAFRGLALPEVYVHEPDGETQLTSLNTAALAGKSVVPPEHFTFNSDGTELDGWVLPPVDYEPGRSYPAILDIHGGPRAAFGSVYLHEMQVWANAGYFVMFTNPRGSAGRGNAFADLRGHWGTIDYADIMAFTDAVLARYQGIDPSRVGVTGGSYGGYMVNWIIGHTDRFAAAVTQRSVTNMMTTLFADDLGYPHNSEDIGLRAWGTDDAAAAWAASPLAHLDKATTPTLVLHSDQDYRCPLVEGLQLFSALKALGVPSKMVVFHGENHELSRSGKPKHRVRRLNEITDWFERYLKTSQ
ncbi:MAG: S9 family peptidase [Propionibacteriaceae bacterium]|jgi:acylaminoacyl-peptidase|nr:S9 family peptidase [Propionibacteriaceae bacterium]